MEAAEESQEGPHGQPDPEESEGSIEGTNMIQLLENKLMRSEAKMGQLMDAIDRQNQKIDELEERVETLSEKLHKIERTGEKCCEAVFRR